jgi:hypothetical protein
LTGWLSAGYFDAAKRREHSDTGALRGVITQLAWSRNQPDAVVSRTLIKKPAGTVRRLR